MNKLIATVLCSVSFACEGATGLGTNTNELPGNSSTEHTSMSSTSSTSMAPTTTTPSTTTTMSTSLMPTTTTDDNPSSGTTGSESPCGNSVLDPGEVCDNSAEVIKPACKEGPEGCKGYESYCGDLNIDTMETCDDGNTDRLDGCVSCVEVSCGEDPWPDDGVCYDGDGDSDDYDGCPTSCKAERFMVFASKTTTNGKIVKGNLAGLAAADAICQSEAEDAGLVGTYRAWLSTTTTTASERIKPVESLLMKPFSLRNKLVVASTWTHLTDSNKNLSSSIYVAADKDTPLVTTTAWTGTTRAGGAATTTCDDWAKDMSVTSFTGSTIAVDSNWTKKEEAACSLVGLLYCFQTDFSPPCGNGIIEAHEDCDDGNNEDYDGCPSDCRAAYSMLFVSTQKVTGSIGGVDAADVLCNQEATDKNLSGKYTAWLSSQNRSAWARLDWPSMPFDKPFHNIDGVQIASDLSGFLSGTLLAPIGEADVEVWTNTDAAGAPVATGSEKLCDDWNSNSPGFSSAVGFAASTDQAWTDAMVGGCDAERSLYCIQTGF